MKRVGWAAMAMLLFPPVCEAQDGPVEEKLRALERRIAVLERRLGEQERCMREQKLCIAEQQKKILGYETRLLEMDQRLHREVAGEALRADGLRIGASATMIAQGTDNTNIAGLEKQSRADASYSADITLEKEFPDSGSSVFIHLQTGQGGGINDELSLFSSVNADARDNSNVRLTEAWYEQQAFGGDVVWTFGKIDPTSYFDGNEAANDETVQFLSDMFGNNPAIEFPDPGAGVRLGFAPGDRLELEYGVFDADADYEEIGDSLFNIAQVNFKPGFFGLDGNYRFIGWRNGAHHTKWLDPALTRKETYGFAASFDQKIHPAVILFIRYGWQNPRVYDPARTASGDIAFSLEQSWSAGCQVTGVFWGRAKDTAGLALGQAIPSGDYKDADPSRKARPETHLETYYNFRVNDNLSVSPDFQYIWNPFGGDIAGDTSGAAVFGIRMQVDF